MPWIGTVLTGWMLLTPLIHCMQKYSHLREPRNLLWQVAVAPIATTLLTVPVIAVFQTVGPMVETHQGRIEQTM